MRDINCKVILCFGNTGQYRCRPCNLISASVACPWSRNKEHFSNLWWWWEGRTHKWLQDTCIFLQWRSCKYVAEYSNAAGAPAA